MGSGTSAVAAETLNRRWIGIELSENYTNIAKERIKTFCRIKSTIKVGYIIKGVEFDPFFVMDIYY